MMWEACGLLQRETGTKSRDEISIDPVSWEDPRAGSIRRVEGAVRVEGCRKGRAELALALHHPLRRPQRAMQHRRLAWRLPYEHSSTIVTSLNRAECVRSMEAEGDELGRFPSELFVCSPVAIRSTRLAWPLTHASTDDRMPVELTDSG